MPRYIAEITIEPDELVRLGCTAQDVADGIEARLHPVASCHPDETVSSAVTVSVAGVESTAGYGDIATAQGWTDNTLLDLALDYLTLTQQDPAFNAFLQARADAENAQ